MIVALGDVLVQVPQREAAAAVMLSTQQRVRVEPGCISYAFSELVGEPGHYVLLQRWQDRASLDAHYRGGAFSAYQTDITPLLVRTSELEVHVAQESVRPFEAAPLDLQQDD